MRSWKFIFLSFIVIGTVVIVGDILINLSIALYTGRITYQSWSGEKFYLAKGIDGIYRDRYGYIIRNPSYCGLRGEIFRMGRDGMYDWEDGISKEAGCIKSYNEYAGYLEDEWGTYYHDFDEGYTRISTSIGGSEFLQLPNQPDYNIYGYQVGNKFYLYEKELIGVKNIHKLRFIVFSKSQNIFFLTDGRSVWKYNREGLKLLGQYNEGKFTEKDGVFTDESNCYFTGNGNQMIACNPSKIAYVGVDKYRYTPDINGFIKTESGIIDSKNDTAFSDGLHEYDYYGRFLR